jgi:hypothetical protein
LDPMTLGKTRLTYANKHDTGKDRKLDTGKD